MSVYGDCLILNRLALSQLHVIFPTFHCFWQPDVRLIANFNKVDLRDFLTTRQSELLFKLFNEKKKRKKKCFFILTKLLLKLFIFRSKNYWNKVKICFWVTVSNLVHADLLNSLRLVWGLTRFLIFSPTQHFWFMMTLNGYFTLIQNLCSNFIS